MKQLMPEESKGRVVSSRAFLYSAVMVSRIPWQWVLQSPMGIQELQKVQDVHDKPSEVLSP